MRHFSRRGVLWGTAAAAATGIGIAPRRASAGWGGPPSPGLVLEEGVRAERCLEVYLYGGMPTFESFYVAREYGLPDDPLYRNTQYHQFEYDHARVYEGLCGFDADPASWVSPPFAVDENGVAVDLGPLVMALWSRPDIVSRMRVIVNSHDFEPHEAAVPLAMTGLRLGNPRMAGTGTHVQRYWQEREPGARVTPYSYVFTPTKAAATFNTRTASSVGMHPGSAKPLHLRTSADMNLTALLGRTLVGEDAPAVNALAQYYVDRNLARHTGTGGTPLRSTAVSDHAYAIQSVITAPELQALMPEEMWAVGRSDSCTVKNDDVAGMVLRAAVSLLTHPDTPAKYANVVDGGIEPDYRDLPHDTHYKHVELSATNMTHLMSALAERINLPGEGDPTKLDLDDTLIVMTSEFGRSPDGGGGMGFDPDGDGTNHWPSGYTSVMIGGPVQPGVTGSIGPDGNATGTSVTLAEFRAATLAAMGIWPFSAEGFAVGDIPGANEGTEQGCMEWLHSHLLGRT